MTRLDHDAYHVPVMAATCLEYLQPERGGVLVDATLGGGGHTKLLIDAAPPNTTVVAFDADEFAIQRAMPLQEHAKERGLELRLVHANFSTLEEVLAPIGPVSAILFDLGVSSFQFDYHPRGFSYRQAAPLDMRYSPDGMTAADIINTSSEDELIHIFRAYGEDPSARRIANAIVRRRTIAPYQTTVDLRDTVLQHIPPQHQAKTLARVFQALRIAVNHELDVLAIALTEVLPLMDVEGRLVVMSYHSLEDRVVKDIFKQHSIHDGPMPRLEILTRKPVMAQPEELTINPRARSARLRVARVMQT